MKRQVVVGGKLGRVSPLAWGERSLGKVNDVSTSMATVLVAGLGGGAGGGGSAGGVHLQVQVVLSWTRLCQLRCSHQDDAGVPQVWKVDTAQLVRT